MERFRPIEMLNLVPSLPLASTSLAMMVCVYFYASERNKIWAALGVAFSIVYTAMASINYLIQLLVVRNSIAVGETERLGLFAHTNPHGVLFQLGITVGLPAGLVWSTATPWHVS